MRIRLRLDRSHLWDRCRQVGLSAAQEQGGILYDGSTCSWKVSQNVSDFHDVRERDQEGAHFRAHPPQGSCKKERAEGMGPQGQVGDRASQGVGAHVCPPGSCERLHAEVTKPLFPQCQLTGPPLSRVFRTRPNSLSS